MKDMILEYDIFKAGDCPRCGSSNITTWPYVEDESAHTEYTCRDCGYELVEDHYE